MVVVVGAGGAAAAEPRRTVADFAAGPRSPRRSPHAPTASAPGKTVVAGEGC